MSAGRWRSTRRRRSSAIGRERLPVVRELFRNLVTAQGTRAVRDVDELLSVFADAQREIAARGAPGADRRAAADLLRGRRAGGREQPHRVEIVHESLLASWPRLVRWQTQDADGRAAARPAPPGGAPVGGEGEAGRPAVDRDVVPRVRGSGGSAIPGGLSEVEEAFGRRDDGAGRAAAAAAANRLRRRPGLSSPGRRRGSGRCGARACGTGEPRPKRPRRRKLLALGRLKLADSPNAALAYAIAQPRAQRQRPGAPLRRRGPLAGPAGALPLRPYRADFVAWSPDGRWLALGGASGASSS